MLEGIGNFETQQLKEWSCQLFILETLESKSRACGKRVQFWPCSF